MEDAEKNMYAINVVEWARSAVARKMIARSVNLL
jgi:hypothetical protein